MGLTPPTTPTAASPHTPSNPEDSAFLQAIESIEAQGINPDPKPYDPASLSARVPRRTPVSSPGTQVIEPTLATQPKPQPRSTPTPRPPLATPSPAQPRPISTPSQPRPEPVQLKQVVAPQPRAPAPIAKAAPSAPTAPVAKRHKPSTIAEAIMEELRNSPDISLEDAPFQPFPRKPRTHKHSGAILAIAAGLTILGAGGYFFFIL